MEQKMTLRQIAMMLKVALLERNMTLGQKAMTLKMMLKVIYSTYKEWQSTLIKIVRTMIKVKARRYFIMVQSQLLYHLNLTKAFYSGMYNTMMKIVKILIKKRSWRL